MALARDRCWRWFDIVFALCTIQKQIILQVDAVRSKNLLRKDALGEFTGWLRAQGWLPCQIGGQQEVLRMHHPDKASPLMVFRQKGLKKYYVTAGTSDRLVRQWLMAKGVRKVIDLIRGSDLLDAQQD